MNCKLDNRAIAIVVTLLLLPACAAQPQANTPTTQTTNAEPDLAVEAVAYDHVDPSDLTGNLAGYMGQEIAVRGQASDSVGNHAFILEDDQWTERESVLVFNATGIPFLLPDNNIAVRATGQVRQFALAELELEFGVELEANLYRPYEGQPVLIAEAITLAPEPETIINNPQAFYGRVVTVQGNIDSLMAPAIFQLESDRPLNEGGLLVMGNTPDTTLTQGQPGPGDSVVVTGILHPFRKAELEQEYALNWEPGIRTQLEAEYSNEPALLAQEISRVEP